MADSQQPGESVLPCEEGPPPYSENPSDIETTQNTDGGIPMTKDSKESSVALSDLPINEASVPLITEATYDWKEITSEFFSACSELSLGELLHDTSFGLFEAMSAIEMMDPKMDAGMMCNQAQRKVYNLEQGVEAGEVKVKDLTMPELVGIIDDTIACMVTWLEGHSLAQTVFTNLYLHNPYIIEDRALKAFSICILKTIDLIRDRINRASVFEEEDFQPMTYGFKMAGDVTDVRCSGMVKEVEEELTRIIKNTRSKVGEERDELTAEEHKFSVAVHARLKFCRLFFSSILLLSKEKCQGITEAQKILVQLKDLHPTVRKSMSIGITPENTVTSPCDYPTIMGFEPMVNQRLLPPTFPRYTKIKTREEAYTYMDELINNLQNVCTVTEYTDLHSLMDFFSEFSKTSPCVFSRSILQTGVSLLLREQYLPVLMALMFLSQSRRVFGSTPIIDSVRDCIRAFLLPPSLMNRGPLSNNPQAKEYVDAFLLNAVRSVISIFQIMGNNRARQRDKWGHLMDDIANLQDESNKLDAFLHRMLQSVDQSQQHLANFGTWVLYHTLQIMIHYTLAGFELELYAVHEYHYIFWYLYDCLYRWQLSTLSRADNFFLKHQEYINEQQQKGRSNKKRDKKTKRKVRPHAKEALLLQAAQNMCGGYYKAVVGLQMAGKLKQPTFEFDSEEVRFNHRFAPFGVLLTPPPVKYSQFLEMTDLTKYDPPVTPVHMYSGACECFQQAKTFYESISNPSEEVQCLLKIAKTNFVVLKLLFGGHKKGTEDPPEFDFSLHKIFPVIKIV